MSSVKVRCNTDAKGVRNIEYDNVTYSDFNEFELGA